ncbi:MAG: MGH1-like glycoside hydrolase domain-containing protein, partial [Miltoncostaeaceae bacterium]
MNGVTSRVRTGAQALLAANWREGMGRDGARFGYTCPDGAKYPYQWFWDSLMHALAWNEVDPTRAATELRSLAAAQRADGLIGHTVFWEQPVR